jgi:PPOX class probable F420-dependent enzyme
MSDRARASMTAAEADAMLAECRKVHLATRNPDGSTHLVSMFYVVLDGRITFWTYRSSQKARNLARDPRVTCLVETGEHYFELRGVQVRGVARCIDDPAEVLDIGRRIAAGLAGVPGDALDDYVAHAARKRIAFTVEADRISSWDHRRLLT